MTTTAAHSDQAYYPGEPTSSLFRVGKSYVSILRYHGEFSGCYWAASAPNRDFVSGRADNFTDAFNAAVMASLSNSTASPPF